METDDRQLIAELRQENTRDLAFNRLVKTYQERLYWHIRKMVLNHDDTDDILQNTFVKVWKSIGSFREESKLYTWLYRIATNEAITFLNSKIFFPPKPVLGVTVMVAILTSKYICFSMNFLPFSFTFH